MQNSEHIISRRDLLKTAALAGAGLFLYGDLAFPDVALAASAPVLSYAAHVADKGWLSQVTDGQTAGTTGENRQMEALKVFLKDGGSSAVTYRAHVADAGWKSWQQSGGVAGTTGAAKDMQALEAKLTGSYANSYNLYYRSHVANIGWLGWARDGATSGSTGLALPVQAVQMRLIAKGKSLSAGGAAYLTKPSLSYKAHVSDVGWQSSVGEGKTAGTTGQARQMEALVVSLKDFNGKSGVSVRAHVADVGWQSFVESGKTAGTTGKGKAMEAVQIKLSDSLSSVLDIYYRVHVRNVGWCGYAKNGETAGSTGLALPIEAIEIVLRNKKQPLSSGGSPTVTTAPASSSTQTSYTSKANAFLNDSRWRNGTSWSASQRPKLSGYSASGCCAYAVDFCQYVFGASSYRSGSSFSSPSAIRAGDVIKVTGSQHWFVVISRNGDSLYTAEGNWGSKVVVSNGTYQVRGNTLYRNGSKFRTFSAGYHMQ